MERAPAPEPLTSTDLGDGVSVVVPVYGGAGTIAELAQRLAATLDGTNWELIFVVDGSPDDSWDVVCRLGRSMPQVRGLRLFRNFGQHNALLAGIRAARHATVVTMDDDLQHRPETVPTLLAALTDDIDLVYGRSSDEEHDAWRNLASRAAKGMMTSVLGGTMARDSGAFRAFRTSIRAGFEHVQDPYVSIDVLLSWVTTRYTTVETPMDQRTVGTSNYTVRALVRHAVNMVTGYSTKPLRLVTWLGFAMAAFGGCALVFVIGRYVISGSSVPGFAFLASLISILAGTQLFGLGVIGEYVGRMHFRSMHRPVYVVRESVGPMSVDEPDPNAVDG